MEAPIWPFHLGKPHCQFVEHVGGEVFGVFYPRIFAFVRKRETEGIFGRLLGAWLSHITMGRFFGKAIVLEVGKYLYFV